MRMPLAARLAAACLCLGLVAACQTAPPRPTYPDLRFTSEPPIRLDAAALDIRVEYQAPGRPPNVEHLFPVTPAHAAENWARDRLKPTGRANVARFIIRTASVTETELPKTEGIKGAFTTDVAQRYDAVLEASVQIVDERGLVLRAASVTAKRSQSVLEGLTINDREQAWYDMTKTLLADFDQQMANEIRNNFGLYFVQ